MSQLFTKTRREAPADETAVNAALLIRGGFVHKVMAGVYAYLPLGLRVLKNIEEIIRQEMNVIGGQEVLLTALQDPFPWEKTGRWSEDVIDVWFKTQLGDSLVGLANTHEEALTYLLTHQMISYKDLPFSIYQFQTKFRNEPRAKSGILRTREFIMKDLYSFSRTEEEHAAFYEKAKIAYQRIFEKAGIGEKTYITFASGGSFSKFSHEFQTVCETGEDTIYIDEEKHQAINKEILDDTILEDIGMRREYLKETKSIEVGNIFSLGTKFSDPLQLLFTDEQGEKHPVIMGSYGMGPGRLMGTVVELFHDQKGIRWPRALAPYHMHLIALDGKEQETERLARLLEDHRRAVLYDDRADKTAGEKFADADLIGIPLRVVVSKRTLAQNKVEIKKRDSEDAILVSFTNILNNYV